MPGIAEQGFEILPDVFDRADLASVLPALEGTAIHRSRAGARNIFQLAGVRALAHDGRLMQLARSCLGGSAFPFRATLFEKSPQQNWLVVWHQDTPSPFAGAARWQGGDRGPSKKESFAPMLPRMRSSRC